MDAFHFIHTQAIVAKVEQSLDRHDKQLQDKERPYQVMVLAQTKDAAHKFQKAYEDETLSSGICRVYTTDTGDDVPLNNFNDGGIRTLVVVGKLCELGYDNKHVSVVAITHNVALSSHVLFAQLVGRAVQKLKDDDPVTAVVVSHPKFEQRPNYDHFDQVADHFDQIADHFDQVAKEEKKDETNISVQVYDDEVLLK